MPSPMTRTSDQHSLPMARHAAWRTAASAIAAATLLGLPTPARSQADQSNFGTEVGYTINGQVEGKSFNASQVKLVSGRASNDTVLTLHKDMAAANGGAAADVHVDAKSTRGVIGAKISGSIATGTTLARGSAIFSAFGTMFDTLTLHGKNTGKHVKMHSKLTVVGNNSAAASGRRGDPNSPVGDSTSAQATVSVSLSGTGIDRVLDLAFREESITDEGIVSIDQEPPNSVDLVIDLIVGQPTRISHELNVFGRIGVAEIDNVFHSSGSASVTGNWIHTIKWAPGTFFTDADTGEVLDDVTLTSASGFDYLNPTFPAEGVPEPATWSLFIAGLGLLGAMLRRGRRAIALAGA